MDGGVVTRKATYRIPPFGKGGQGGMHLSQTSYSNRCVIAFSTAWVRSRQSSFTSTSDM